MTDELRDEAVGLGEIPPSPQGDGDDGREPAAQPDEGGGEEDGGQ